MKKILHLINNDHDGIFHFVNKHTNESLKEHDNIILTKYSSSKNVISLDSGNSLNKFIFKPTLVIKNLNEFFLKILNKLKRDYYNLNFKPDVLFNFYFNEINFFKLTKKIKELDIIIIYTFKEILSPKDLKKIREHYKCKIIFYPLDFELLSGGFHFENYDKKNKKLERKNQQLISYKNFFFLNLNIHWIAANKYVEDKIKSSPIYNIENHKVSKIYNNYKKFNFSDRDISNYKVENNLDKFDLILLYSSLKLSDERKGVNELKDCLKYYENLPNKKYKIAIISLGKEKSVNLKNQRIKHIHLNYISDPKKLNLLFRSCDIFLNLSKYDFGPILCEIAFHNNLFILSSNVGIAEEIVVNNVNGFIYENNDELCQKFKMIIDLAIKNNLKENNQISKMKKNYSLNKSKEFNQIFDE